MPRPIGCSVGSTTTGRRRFQACFADLERIPASLRTCSNRWATRGNFPGRNPFRAPCDRRKTSSSASSRRGPFFLLFAPGRFDPGATPPVPRSPAPRFPSEAAARPTAGRSARLQKIGSFADQGGGNEESREKRKDTGGGQASGRSEGIGKHRSAPVAELRLDRGRLR